MNQSFDAFLDLHEYAEVGNRSDLAVDPSVQWVALGNCVPGIGRQLFDTKADSFVLRIDSQDYGLEFVALLYRIRGMTNLFGPGKIGDVNQSVDPRLDLHESAKVGNRLDLAL